MGVLTMTAAVAISLTLGMQTGGPGDRLYARVHTAGGDVLEGFVRWDRNEGSWADLLNGTKEIPWENLRDAERLDDDYASRRARERSVRVLGLRISWDEDDEDSRTTVSAALRFGHIRSIEVRSDRRAVLVLKSGEEVEFRTGSTDLGPSLRGLIVDTERGEVELRWRDLETVDFMAAPAGARQPAAARLWGTMRTSSGASFTGYIAWDVDEILASDVLDGEERGRDRKIPFDRIAAIERAGSSGARVILVDGGEVTLRGSNDVDSGNRGIAVSDPGLGQVQVSWDEFESVEFRPAPPATGVGYDAFDGGLRLHGTVSTAAGDQVVGWIRWDNDEEYDWEMLDGEEDGIDFDIEFAQILHIRKLGSWGSEVTLLDGRTFTLERSNDVDEDNKGIFVTGDDGEMVLVPWWEFAEVTFSAR